MTSVMLIEDDPSMLSLLGTLLEFEGFTVLHPADDRPESVMTALRDQKPEVALMDVHLRLFNGLDLLLKAKQDPTIQATRFIIASGMDLDREAKNNGAEAFIMKPYMPDDLIALIQKVSG